MADKVIVTNLSALKAKYGAAGVAVIKKSITNLIAADKLRGLKTRLVALDDAKQMKTLKATAVTKAADPKQNKQAVDGIYKTLQPDYLVLLGAVDVIPHQDLRNPIKDDDKLAPGDLPYACEHPYSQAPQDFIGPTRVVGRLPDLTGGSKPEYLLNLLQTATAWQQAAPADYTNYFGLTAKVWEESTRQSLNFIFGNAKGLKASPKLGPNWKAAELNPRMHFINAHGADSEPTFYGQTGDNYPQCHEASIVGTAGNLVEGTVVAAECCYGGQLYNPGITDGQMGICYAYLAGKAYGFLGSTTIAYGPPADNGQADLICKFFLRLVLNGASLGRAALEARQRFVKESDMGPSDLKTLAQFNLYGDPSITPVKVPSSKVAFGTNVVSRGAAKAFSPAAMRAAQEEGEIGVKERRLRGQHEGRLLLETQHVAGEQKAAVSKTADNIFKKILQEYDGLELVEESSYDVLPPPLATKALAVTTRGAKAAGKGIAEAPAETRAFHVLVCRAKGAPQSARSMAARSVANGPAAKGTTRAAATRGIATDAGTETATATGPTPSIVLFEAKEVGGKIVSVREIHSK